jgi:hypothetical protein
VVIIGVVRRVLDRRIRSMEVDAVARVITMSEPLAQATFVVRAHRVKVSPVSATKTFEIWAICNVMPIGPHAIMASPHILEVTAGGFTITKFQHYTGTG